MTDLSDLSNGLWEEVCALSELPVDAGMAALIKQNSSDEQQVALFKTEDSDTVYAIGNFDPFSEANVLARGIVCSINDEPAVASPVLKEHFSLLTGQCFEDQAVSVPTYTTNIVDGRVFVHVTPNAEIAS